MAHIEEGEKSAREEGWFSFEAFPLLGRPLMNIIDITTDYMYFVEEKIMSSIVWKKKQ